MLKHVVLAFVIALVGYAILYQWIEQRRAAKGPWRVTFAVTTNGVPLLTINQLRLSITNVQLLFPGEMAGGANLPTTLVFEQPRQVPYELPFGKCIFMDTTFLPGTVTFQVFGHEIELLPRVLMIDHEERAWKTAGRIWVP
jgi:hypothetical protein